MPDPGKSLIEYKFVPSGKHLRIEANWSGRHPQQAIDHAKAALERYARSQYDEIKIYSKKYMGRVYFHVSGMQQMIDWQPAKAPPRNSHGGEIRARGIDSLARRGVSFKKYARHSPGTCFSGAPDTIRTCDLCRRSPQRPLPLPGQSAK
jgi:hypothetical protein